MNVNDLELVHSEMNQLQVNHEAQNSSRSISDQSSLLASKTNYGPSLLLSPIKEKPYAEDDSQDDELYDGPTQLDKDGSQIKDPQSLFDKVVKESNPIDSTESHVGKSLTVQHNARRNLSPFSCEELFSKSSALGQFFSEAVTHLIAGVRHLTMEINECLGAPVTFNSVAAHISNVATAQATLEIVNSVRQPNNEEGKIPHLSLCLLEEVEQGGLSASVLPFALLRKQCLGEDNAVTHIESASAILNLLGLVAKALEKRRAESLRECQKHTGNYEIDPLLLCLLKFMCASLVLFTTVIHISPLAHEFQESLQIVFTKILHEITTPEDASNEEQNCMDSHPLFILMSNVNKALGFVERCTRSIESGTLATSSYRLKKLLLAQICLLKLETQLLLPSQTQDRVFKEGANYRDFDRHEVEAQLNYLTDFPMNESENSEANSLSMIWLMVTLSLFSDSKTRFNRVCLVNRIQETLNACIEDKNAPLNEDLLDNLSNELAGQRVDHALIFPALLNSGGYLSNTNGVCPETNSKIDYWLRTVFQKSLSNRAVVSALGRAKDEALYFQSVHDKHGMISCLLDELEQKGVFAENTLQNECSPLCLSEVAIPPAGWMTVVQTCLEDRINLLGSASQANELDKSTIEIDSALSGHCLVFVSSIPLLFTTLIAAAGEVGFDLNSDSFNRHSLAPTAVKTIGRIQSIPSCIERPKNLMDLDWVRLSRNALVEGSANMNPPDLQVYFYKAWEAFKYLKFAFGDSTAIDNIDQKQNKRENMYKVAEMSLRSCEKYLCSCFKAEFSSACLHVIKLHAIFVTLLFIQRDVSIAPKDFLLPCDEPPAWRVQETLQEMWTHSRRCESCQIVCSSKEFNEVESSILLMAELLEEVWINPDVDEHSPDKTTFWSIVGHTLQKFDEMFHWTSHNVIAHPDFKSCCRS